MSINDEWFRYLRASGYTGSVNDMMRQALISETSVDPTPIACTVTLTHDGLGAFGFAPMSVTGQTVSVTGDGTSNYGMSTGLAGVPVDWSGVRIVEHLVTEQPANGFGILNFLRPDQTVVRVSWNYGDGEWNAEGVSLATDTRIGFVRLGGSVTDVAAIGIDGATGDAVVYLNGSPVVTSSTTADQGTFAGLAGMFASDNVIIVDVASELALGDAYSAEIITQADKYTQTYPAGTLDWCGNPL